MSDPLTWRLNQILPKLTSNDFLKTRGIGNEIAFYIKEEERRPVTGHECQVIPKLRRILTATSPHGRD